MDKICAKPMYKCAICGEVYDSIAQRMNCEQTCLKKQEEEAKKAAEEEMKTMLPFLFLIMLREICCVRSILVIVQYRYFFIIHF